MFYVIRVQNSQLNSYSNSVVSSQSRTFSMQPFVLDVGLNRIIVEVEFNVY